MTVKFVDDIGLSAVTIIKDYTGRYLVVGCEEMLEKVSNGKPVVEASERVFVNDDINILNRKMKKSLVHFGIQFSTRMSPHLPLPPSKEKTKEQKSCLIQPTGYKNFFGNAATTHPTKSYEGK